MSCSFWFGFDWFTYRCYEVNVGEALRAVAYFHAEILAHGFGKFAAPLVGGVLCAVVVEGLGCARWCKASSFLVLDLSLYAPFTGVGVPCSRRPQSA